MVEFPLQPFLRELAAEGFTVTMRDYDRISLVLRGGGAWTVAQLRETLAALLARSPQQQEVFRQRFDQFFAPELTQVSLKEVDPKKALAALSALRKPELPESTRKTPAWLFWVLTVLGLASIALGLWACWILYQTPEIPPLPVPEQPPSPMLTASAPPPPMQSILTAVGGPLAQLPGLRNYWDMLVVSPLLWLPMLLFWYFWQRSQAHAQTPEAATDPPEWDENKARHFRRGTIGGPTAARLPAKTLDELAAALGYFSDDTGRRLLDGPASARATIKKGGLPTLVYRERRKLRCLYVLDDKLAEARSWNTLPRELADGLTARGLNVVHGYFSGVPAQCQTVDGHSFRLADLENERRQHILLLFSDCQGLQRESLLMLRQLAEWPQCAWLEMREPRAWDARTALVAQAGVPLFPATAEGLARALKAFNTDTARAAQPQVAQWRGLQPRGRTALAVYVEYLLGDALRWAQAGAMTQPVTLGLADALRREFLPHLPPERLERLLLLPNTHRSAAGLQFSDEVLAVLRAGFAVRWDAARQEAILRFILEQIRAAEPPEADSLAHLAWEWALERARLELEPDAALSRLHALAQTPLGNAIRADLENVILPGTQPAAVDPFARPLIPLRRWPESPAALQQLASLAEQIEAPKLTISPVRLEFNQLRREARYTKALRIANKGGVIQGRLTANAAWLSCEPDNFSLGLAPSLATETMKRKVISAQPTATVASESDAPQETPPPKPWARVVFRVNRLLEVANAAREKAKAGLPQRFTVSVDTTGLALGAHEGAITVKTAGGACSVPVSIYVRRSWQEALAFWWQRLQVFAATRLVQPTIYAAFAAFILILILPPNWVNQHLLRNKPPQLASIDAAINERADASQTAAPTLVARADSIALTARANDPEGAALSYEWQIDNKAVAGNGAQITAMPTSDNFKVALRLRDANGGQAQYQQDFNVSQQLTPLPTPTPGATLFPDKPTPTPTPKPRPTPIIIPGLTGPLPPTPPVHVTTPPTPTPTVVSVTPTPTPTPAQPGQLIGGFTAQPATVKSGDKVNLCWQIRQVAGQLSISETPSGKVIYQNSLNPNFSAQAPYQIGCYEVAVVVDGKVSFTLGVVTNTKDTEQRAVEVIVNNDCQPAGNSFSYPLSTSRYNLRASLRVDLLCAPKGKKGRVGFTVQLLNDPRGNDRAIQEPPVKPRDIPNSLAHGQGTAFMTLSYNWVVEEKDLGNFQGLLQKGLNNGEVNNALNQLAPLLDSTLKANPTASGFDLTRIFQNSPNADDAQNIWRKLFAPYFNF